MASKAFKLEDFTAIIPSIEFNEPAPFKNQAGASRITASAGGTNFIKVQLCGEKDALYCPFGCTRKPTRMEGKTPIFDDSQPPAYSTSFAIPPGSPQFDMFTRLENKLNDQATKSPAWFAKLPPAKRKNPEANLIPLLKEPTPAANGEIKYPDYTLRCNTKPEMVKVFIMQPPDSQGIKRLVAVKHEPHLAITARSRTIPIINLGYIYITNIGWGVTWYLDSIIVIPGDAVKTAGLDAFNDLGDGMQVDESAEQPARAVVPPPSLQQVQGGRQALAEGTRPTMDAPFDLDDVLMDV